jgi:hypothetical protein
LVGAGLAEYSLELYYGLAFNVERGPKFPIIHGKPLRTNAPAAGDAHDEDHDMMGA